MQIYSIFDFCIQDYNVTWLRIDQLYRLLSKQITILKYLHKIYANWTTLQLPAASLLYYMLLWNQNLKLQYGFTGLNSIYLLVMSTLWLFCQVLFAMHPHSTLYPYMVFMDSLSTLLFTFKLKIICRVSLIKSMLPQLISKNYQAFCPFNRFSLTIFRVQPSGTAT